MDSVMPKVKPTTFKVISAVARQTWGWKGRESVELSYTDITKLTGISSVNTIKSAICEAQPYINQVVKDGQGFEYSMKPIEETVSKNDTEESESLSKNDTDTDGTMSINDTVLCQNLTESLSKNDTDTSGLKEEKENNNNNNDDDDLTFADAIRAYENNIAVIGPTISQDISVAVEEVGAKWVIDAVKIAARKNVKNWSYIAAILKNWQTLGYQDIKQPGNGRVMQSAHNGTANTDGSFY